MAQTSTGATTSSRRRSTRNTNSRTSATQADNVRRRLTRGQLSDSTRRTVNTNSSRGGTRNAQIGRRGRAESNVRERNAAEMRNQRSVVRNETRERMQNRIRPDWEIVVEQQSDEDSDDDTLLTSDSSFNHNNSAEDGSGVLDDTYLRDSFVVSDEEENSEFDFEFEDMPDTQNGLGRQRRDGYLCGDGNDEPLSENDPNDPSIIRSSEHGHCNICFEDAPYDPVGCLMCRQLIGCKKCVMNWFKRGLQKKARHDENASNHFQCPLCRHEWEGEPEIDSIFSLD